MISYELIRSNRKTIAIEVHDTGVIVKAPLRVSKFIIDNFVKEKQSWIQKKIQEVDERKLSQSKIVFFTQNEINELKKLAQEIIPSRVKYYAEIIGVEYNTIKIKKQKSRWGSCSSNKNLNFNFALVEFSIDIIDSVIIHELCHLKEMNHGKNFYSLVYKYCPNYKALNNELKQKGNSILDRIP